MRYLTRRKLLAGGCAMLVLGCATAPPQMPVQRNTQNTPVVVNFNLATPAGGAIVWSRPAGTLLRPLLEHQQAGFTERNGQSRLQPQDIPLATANEVYLSMLAADTVPDLLWLEMSTNPNAAASVEYWAAHSLLIDLETLFLHRTLKLDDYHPGALDLCRYRNRVWGMPFEIIQHLTFLNTTLLQRAGLPLPRATWSWLDALAVTQKIQKGTGAASEQWGWLPPPWWVMAYQSGSKLSDDNGNRMLLDSASTATALGFLHDLYRRYQVAPRTADFASGKLGIAYESSARFDEFQKSEFEWIATTHPTGPGSGAANQAGQYTIQCWCVSRSSRNRDAAMQLAYYLGMGAGAEIWASGGHISPVKRFDLPHYVRLSGLNPRQSEGFGRILQMILDNIRLGRCVTRPAYANGRNWSEVLAVAEREIQPALDGQRTIGDAIAAAEQATRNFILGER